MKPFLALGLLMERPLWLIGGPLGLLFVVMAPWFMAPDDVVFSAGLDAGITGSARDILWRGTLAVSGYLGCMVGIITGEVKGTFSSWMLNGLRRRFTVALTGILLLLVLLAGALHANVGSSAARGAAIAGFTYTTFLLLGQGQARRLTIAWALVLTTAFLRPGVIVALELVAAVVFVAAIPLVALWFVSAQLSSDLHRQQVLARENRLADPPRWLRFILHVDRRPMKVAASPKVADWFRASFMATQRSIGSWVLFQMAGGLFIGAVIYAFGDPSLAGTIVIISGLSVSWTGLDAGHVFPLSRRTRADLRYCWNLFEAIRIAIVVVAATALFYAVDPFPSLTDPTSSIGVVTAVAMAFIWLPVAQWGNSAPPVQRMVDWQALFGRRHVVSMAALFVGYALTLVAYRSWGRHLDAEFKVTVFAILCALTYGGSLYFLRRAYATSDLV